VGLLSRVRALLGVSTYRPPALPGGPELGSDQVDEVRRYYGGQLQPTPSTKTRWLLSDVESAERLADTGDIALAAKLIPSARRDGTYAGVLSTRTDGLVRLPKRFRGLDEIVQALELGHDQTRSIFDEMFPPSELALLAADGIELGVGVAELVPVDGRDYPVMVRMDPEFLRYRWNENQWYFRSVAGLLPIVPGDGRWVLHVPGGRNSPWSHGTWRAVGRAYVRKEHAQNYKSNWESKLANPARVAVAPQGATEAEQQSWFRSVMAWGTNTVFGMKPGYDVKLLESNGQGYESFIQTIQDQNDEFKLATAGQLVTSDGGAGFQNSDIHKSIRADLIKSTADALAYTLNTQGIPPFVYDRFGEQALIDGGAVVEWDVTPPKDRNAEAAAMQSAAVAIQQMTRALSMHGKRLDIEALANQFGVPLDGELELASENNKLELAPTDIAKVVTAKEVRSSQGLEPLGDERDDLTISEIEGASEDDPNGITADNPQEEAA